MTVSIIIPVYNVENYLRRCLDTVIHQTYTDIEIILIDDGSTDFSGKICHEFAERDSRIKVLHKKNGGLSDARNKGILMATGEWITFIDSDDYVTDTYVEELLNLIQKYDADVSIATYTYITPNKEINHATGELVVMDTETAIKRMLLNDGFDMGAWAKMYRSEYFKGTFFPVGKLFEDSMTTYEVIGKAERIVFESKSIYFYVNRPNSIVNRSFNMKKFDLIEMNEKNEIFIKKKFPNIASEAHRRVIWAYFSTLNQVLSSNDQKVIEEHAPKLAEYILNEGAFILKKSFVPKRDKIAYIVLKMFGVQGYKKAWDLYLRKTR